MTKNLVLFTLLYPKVCTHFVIKTPGGSIYFVFFRLNKGLWYRVTAFISLLPSLTFDNSSGRKGCKVCLKHALLQTITE